MNTRCADPLQFVVFVLVYLLNFRVLKICVDKDCFCNFVFNILTLENLRIFVSRTFFGI